ILNTFEKNYCEGHRHTPHALGDPSEVVSELLFFDNIARKYFCVCENPDFWPVRGVKTSHAVAGGFPEPLTEGPGRAPYCSVTPGFAVSVVIGEETGEGQGIAR